MEDQNLENKNTGAANDPAQMNMVTPQSGSFPKSGEPEYVDRSDLGRRYNTDFYAQKGAYTINPKDHFVDDPHPDNFFGGDRSSSGTKRGEPARFKPEYLIPTEDHFTYDPNDPESAKYEDKVIKHNDAGDYYYRTFSGSATILNPEKDEEKQMIIEQGLESREDQLAAKNGQYQQPPISPFHPFTRMDPLTAQRSNYVSYNRSHIPIADSEFRKGFRHIFITRPECYIMCVDGGLSEQAKYDENFASSYMRFPYILELLSPSYLPNNINTGLDGLVSNWNYLLSNRVTSMNLGTMELATSSNMAKSTTGQQIIYPTLITSEMNGSLQLTFNETKEFEVSEMIRMWMMYMNNIHRGIFSPSYNGYRYHNDFGGYISPSASPPSFDDSAHLHPLDRAVDYPCTIFDIITNESDTKILYYCAYLGAFPTQLSRPFNTQNSGAIATQLQVSVGFQYQAKIENNNKMLVQFNYNSGIIDSLGRPTKQVGESFPFLLEHGELKTNPLMKNYIGASGMFTGSPYVVIGASQRNPLKSGVVYAPYLKFAPILEDKFNDIANLGIINHSFDVPDPVVSVGEASESEMTSMQYSDTELQQMAQAAEAAEIATSDNGKTGNWRVDAGNAAADFVFSGIEALSGGLFSLDNGAVNAINSGATEIENKIN